MNKNNSITLGVISIILLLATIPMNWFTIPLNSAMGMPSMPFPGGLSPSAIATGTSGSLTFFGLQLPIYLVILIACTALVLSILNLKKITAIPTFVNVTLLIISTVYLVAGLVVVASSNGTSIKAGFFLALLATILGFAHLITARNTTPTQNADALPE